MDQQVGRSISSELPKVRSDRLGRSTVTRPWAAATAARGGLTGWRWPCRSPGLESEDRSVVVASREIPSEAVDKRARRQRGAVLHPSFGLVRPLTPCSATASDRGTLSRSDGSRPRFSQAPRGTSTSALLVGSSRRRFVKLRTSTLKRRPAVAFERSHFKNENQPQFCRSRRREAVR